MTEDTDQRSVDACPRCGAHRLAAVEPPQLGDLGFQPLNEIYVVGQAGGDPVVPSIECLDCGATWRDLEAFRTEQRDVSGHGSA